MPPLTPTKPKSFSRFFEKPTQQNEKQHNDNNGINATKRQRVDAVIAIEIDDDESSRCGCDVSDTNSSYCEILSTTRSVIQQQEMIDAVVVVNKKGTNENEIIQTKINEIDNNHNSDTNIHVPHFVKFVTSEATKKISLGSDECKNNVQSQNLEGIDVFREEITNTKLDSDNVVDNSNHFLDASCTVGSIIPPSTEGSETEVNNKTISFAEDLRKHNRADEEIPMITATTNPFAKFAASYGQQQWDPNKQQQQSQSRQLLLHHSSLTTPKIVKQSCQQVIKTKKIEKNYKCDNATTISTTCTDSKQQYVPMHSLSNEKQNECVQKWHSLLCNEMNNDHIENRRYQLYFFVKLHVQCQETTVRKAIQNVYNVIPPSTFTIQNIVSMVDDPTRIVECIKQLQYHNVKVKHLIQSSQEILNNHEGIVPERADELKKLIGIGPVLADLLEFVNTREQHMKYLDEHVRRSREE